jgi:hypothetical protein
MRNIIDIIRQDIQQPNHTDKWTQLTIATLK